MLEEVARVLDELLPIPAEDGGGVLVPASGAVRRIGLLLEPPADLGRWVRDRSLNALFLHRPWRADLAALPAGVGVVASHRGFDAHLTVGRNRWLAEALGLRDVREMAVADGVPRGMTGELAAPGWTPLLRAVEREMGGVERHRAPGHPAVTRVAVVGAMTDALVREADALGAQVYVTGQWRVPAERAVEETGVGVITTGHRASERWGVRMLARLLAERFPALETVLEPEAAG